MTEWRISLAENPNGSLPIWGVLSAQLAWKRLSKPARDAVEAAYPDGAVTTHPLTLKALNRHGFVECGHHTNYAYVLTEAGRECARWNVKADI